jgi:NADH-quinone oxidoreductase subunit C
VASTRHQLAPEEAGARLRAQFGQDITDVTDQHGHAVVTVIPGRYHDLVKFLRDDPDFACDYCDFTGGVDWGPEGGFQVITHLFSTTHHHGVRVKVPLPFENPVCPTISDLFPTSNWHERETHEMFGIEFEGHPQPVKLLLPEPFEGHPLRKDFPLMSREAKPWPGAVEGEEEEEE